MDKYWIEKGINRNSQTVNRLLTHGHILSKTCPQQCEMSLEHLIITCQNITDKEQNTRTHST